MGLGARAAQVLSVAPWANLFDEVAPASGEPARRLAAVLEKRIPFHARRTRGSKPRQPREVPDPARISPLVRALEDQEILPEALPWAVDEVLAAPGRSAEEVLEKFKPRADDEEQLEVVLSDVAVRIRAWKWKSPDSAFRWGTGVVLREFFGRVSPSEVRQRLRALLDGPAKGPAEGGLE
jgi:Asp-tRNA(Asn)/Glu-tRNA(Gln) amidotransferase B subunit